MWQTIMAVKNRNVYEVPIGPYRWMGPSSPLKLLMLMWLLNLIYPDLFEYDIHDRLKEFYPLFFHYDIMDVKLDELMVYAKPHAPAVQTVTRAPVFGILAGFAAAVFFFGWRR